MTALVLQARLDSRRLYRKALLPLDGKPLISRVMEALKTVPGDRHILACPEDSLREFRSLAEDEGFEPVAGPKEDVLGRYAQVIRCFAPDRIIRATADNPFVFADAAEAINREGAELNVDYAGYSGLPYGAGVESVSAEALLRAEREARSPAEREHVCPYLYGHPELFLLHRPLAPLAWQEPSLRLTVDTPEDYFRAESLLRALTEAVPGKARYRGETIIGIAKKIFPAPGEVV
ncbi:MAG: NTP transferase domain-containing protein [Spirochaetaceae bacterium]|jgi:spore coat polysaccharide biosynthesis protein SpsF|nr:NTP transferase domain-containing protein [Spirochaetaceae bacterium]